MPADQANEFIHWLGRGNLIESARRATLDLFGIETLVNLVRAKQVAEFETMLRLGFPPLYGEQLSRLQTEIDQLASQEFEDLAARYELYRPPPDGGALEVVLEEVARFCFPFGPSYKRRVKNDHKARRIYFCIGQLESETGAQQEVLPEVLGLVPWSDGLSGIAGRELTGASAKTVGSAMELAVLTRTPTGLKGSALRYDPDVHIDAEFVPWNIAEVWSLQILGAAEFLAFLGRRRPTRAPWLLAFNLAEESMIDADLRLKSDQGGVFDRLKMIGFERARAFKARLGIV